MMSDVTINKTIDARGTYCPGPLMELIKAFKGAASKTAVEVLSSDEGSVKDIPEWVKKTGNELLYVEPEGNYWRVGVRKTK